MEIVPVAVAVTGGDYVLGLFVMYIFVDRNLLLVLTILITIRVFLINKDSRY